MGELQRVARLVAEIPEIIECDRVTGEDCFVAKVFVPRIDDSNASSKVAAVRADQHVDHPVFPVQRRQPPLAR